MFISLIDDICEWAASQPKINAVFLVGSYARGTQKPDSDIDFVILTDDKKHYIDDPRIFDAFGSIDKQKIELYGECTSIRTWYKSGVEAEFGIVTPKWIELPLDSGTKEVLSGGYRILVNKSNILKAVAEIVPEYAL